MRIPAERGKMKEVWELCRRLNNPTRLKLLMDVYSPHLNDGLNVGIAMDDNSLKQSATSSHLAALASLGIIRRCRSGRFVNYYPEISDESPNVAEIARLILERGRKNPRDLAFADVFPVMMNAFRAKAVANIALTDGITLLELAEKYDKEMRLVTRDLKPAVEGGMLSVSAEGPDGIYTYIPPADPIARRIVELSA